MPPPRPLTTRLLSPLRRTPQYAPHLKPQRAYHPSPTSAIESTSSITSHLLRAHPSPQPHCQRQPQRRPYSTTHPPPEPKHYTFEEVRNLSSNPSPKRIIIDVREPSELHQTGRIPGAYSMPLTSNPDAFYLSKEDFFDRFGFEKPEAPASPKSYQFHESTLPAAADTDSEASPTSKSPITSSPFTKTLKDREADAGLNREGDKEGVDSGGVNGEAGFGGGREGEGEGWEEVIFYCKAGVRSRAAARMAREWEGVRVGEMRGGWMEWEGRGGEVER